MSPYNLYYKKYIREYKNVWEYSGGGAPPIKLLHDYKLFSILFTNISYLYLLCSIEKYLFVNFFNEVDKNTIEIRFGKVINPNAASPNPHTASNSAIAPMNTNTRKTILYGRTAL